MSLVVTLDGDDTADELRSLWAWLIEEDELRGCVQTRESPPAAGHLGPVLDALEIVADPVAGVLGAAIVAWLKTRVGDVRLVVAASGGEIIKVRAKNVRGLTPAGVTELTERLSRAAREATATTPAS